MKIRYPISVLMLILVSSLSAYTQTDSPKISGNFINSTFIEFVDAVEKQTPCRFYFESAELSGLIVNLKADNIPLSSALEIVFSRTNFYYVIDPQMKVIITKGKAIAGDFDRTETPSQKNNITLTDVDESENLVIFQEKKTYVIGGNTAKPGNERNNLSGSVVIVGSNLPVMGASIAVENTTLGTITDDRGYYAISLPKGKYRLRITSVGMKPTYRDIILNGEGKLTIQMATEVTNLQEVQVTAGMTSNVKGLQMGVDRLDIQALKYIPTSFGEVDVLRAVLTLPGVKTVGEASSGFNVRGGATDQNLIVYNESTIYNPFHFFGFFSSFAAESIENVELYKSVIPASYGGRLSSVLKINGHKGDKEKYKGSAGIGLLTSRLNLEGPVFNDKTSFAASARTTYSNWLFGFLPSSSGYKNSRASFYDVNLNIDHAFSSRNVLNVNGYISRDESNLNTDTTFTYNNKNISAQWLHEFSEDLSSAITVGHDHYDYGNNSDINPARSYQLNFSIDQTYLKAHFNYALTEKYSFQAGVHSIYYKLKPGSFVPIGDVSEFEGDILPTEQASENALYLDGKFDLSTKLSVQAGVRYSLFSYLGPREVNYYAAGLNKTEENRTGSVRYQSGESIKTYQGPEVRFSARYAFNDKFSVKLGYNTMRQYIHMLSNTITISPTDIWKLSDPNIKPQFSEQVSVGFYKNFNTKWQTSVEAYTKRIEDYLDYKSGSVLVLNHSVETEVITTRGKAYGIEFMVKKPVGNFNGWISYTYSRILLKLDDPASGEKINNGDYYPASYDKPHDFNFTGNQKISHRVSVSVNMNYSTGRPVTIPIGVFSYGGSQKTLYSTRNGYRIPDYFRTDLSINVEGNHKVKQKFKNSWTFGVYNLTGRKNPYSVYYTTNESGAINGYKISIFGSAIPFINYNIRF